MIRALFAATQDVSLTPDTRGLIGSRDLGLMKPTAILVNVAGPGRGGGRGRALGYERVVAMSGK